MQPLKIISRPTEVFLETSVLKICRKFTGGHPRQSAISIKSQSNFIEVTIWHGSSVNLLHIFRKPRTVYPYISTNIMHIF